jgi:ribonuclease D
MGQRISKTQRLSNWESDILQERQKRYAATDAWACILLYEELVRLKQTGDYTLIKVPEPETNVNINNEQE